MKVGGIYGMLKDKFYMTVYGDVLHGGSLTGLVQCSSCHPVCSFTSSQPVSSDCRMSSLPCNTNHHLYLPDLVDCPFTNFRLIWTSFRLLELVRRDMTVVHVFNGSVPHILLAPLTSSLAVFELVLCADPSMLAAPDPFSSREVHTGALLGRDQCCGGFCVVFLAAR